MKIKKILFLVLFSVTFFSCSSYIPLTKNLVIDKKLTPEDLELLQFYSYGYEIKYKGADIKKTSEGIKSGELFKGEQIERNYVIIPMRTAGAVKRVIVDDNGIPCDVFVLYDNELPLFTYKLIDENHDKIARDMYVPSSTTSDNIVGFYCLVDDKLNVNNAIFKNKAGYQSKLFINKDELQKLIEHKKFATGIKVGGTRLKKSEEVIGE